MNVNDLKKMRKAELLALIASMADDGESPSAGGRRLAADLPSAPDLSVNEALVALYKAAVKEGVEFDPSKSGKSLMGYIKTGNGKGHLWANVGFMLK